MNTLNKDFLNPPNKHRVYRIVHSWRNQQQSEQSVYDQVKQLKDYGIGGIVTNAAWHEQYLELEQDFEELKQVINEANTQGLGVWLYDEHGYPSGSAGGRVLEQSPELEALGLVMLTIDVERGCNLMFELPPELLSVYYAERYDSYHHQWIPISEGIREKVIHFPANPRQWKLRVFALKVLFEGSHAENNGFSPRRTINILNRDATKKFLESTYEAYHHQLGAQMQHVEAIFTDEPSLMAPYQNTEQHFQYAPVPWDESLPELFYNMHHYSILPQLNSLFEGDQEQDRAIRVHFYETISHMIAMNYSEQINLWCELHGTRLSGHFLLEESMIYHVGYYGDLMSVVRATGFPGVDMLTARPERFLTDEFSYMLAPKYVSSAARIAGKGNLVMVELCPVDEKLAFDRPSYHELKGISNLLYFCGITQINSYVPESAYTQQEYGSFSEYAGRLGVMMSNAISFPRIAMYYPIETFQANYVPITSAIAYQKHKLWNMHHLQRELALALFNNQRDFNYVDSQAILDSYVHDGSFWINGMPYNIIIMPAVEVLSSEVMQRLIQAEHQGVRILWVEQAPTQFIGQANLDVAEIKQARIEAVGVSQVIPEIAKVLPSVTQDLRLDGANQCFVSQYQLENQLLVYIVNPRAREVSLRIAPSEGVQTSIYYTEDGSIEELTEPTSIELPQYGSVFLVVNNAVI